MNINFIQGSGTYNGNGVVYDKNNSPCFHNSILYNEIQKNSFSTTKNFEIKKNCKNLFYLECKHSLKDFYTKDKDTNKKVLDTLPHEFIEQIKYNDNVKLSLTSFAESSEYCQEYIDGIKSELNRFDIPFNKIIIGDSNYRYSELFSEIKTYNNLHFLRHASNGNFVGKNPLGYVSEFLKIQDVLGNKKVKHFLCFNRNSQKFHRYFLILFLIENNLMDKTTISILRKMDYIRGTRFEYLNKYLDLINEKIPVEIDTQLIEDKMSFSTDETFRKKEYQECFLHLVTETRFSEKNMLFFTEKIIKPILGLQPFIVLSNAFYLKKLKEFGFKTFSSIVDEGYDEIENYEDRLEFIFNEILRISKLSIEEINNLYNSVLDICIYNRNHLIEMTKINDTIEILKDIENEW